MSRPQINAVNDTASSQNKGYYNDAQNSYVQSQNDIGDYQDQLSKYASSNPYVEGGQFQTDSNKVIANTNDAGARAAGEKLQSQALRTGQNSAGDVAATEQLEQQGTRDTAAEEAKANQQRIEGDAGYNKSTLQATEFPAQFAAGMASSMSGAANKALDTQLGAASWKDPAADTWNKEAAEFVGGQPA